MKKATALPLLIVAVLFIGLLSTIYYFKFLVPQQSPSNFANWKTYENKLLKISFLYPASYTLSSSPSSNEDYLSKNVRIVLTKKDNTVINIWINPEGVGGLSDKIYEINYDENYGFKIIGNYKGVKPESDSENTLTIEADYDAGENFRNVSFILNVPKNLLNQFNQEFEQLLSTFKFLDSSTSSAVDTKNWKIYENKKYGFSFKYPSDFLVKDSSEDVVFIKNDPNENREAFAILIKPNMNLTDYLAYLDKTTRATTKDTPVKQTTKSINGFSFIQLEYIDGMDDRTEMIIQHNNNLIVFSNADQILSTFKFL